MNVTLRKVGTNDLKKIYEWRNHPEIRKNSYNENEILWNEHVGYWKKRLGGSGNYSFIVVSDNIDVGLVRLDKRDDSYEVHIMIAPDKQGKGFGTAAIAKVKGVAANLGIKKLIAKVKPANIASKIIFTENGFVKEKDSYQCIL